MDKYGIDVKSLSLIELMVIRGSLMRTLFDCKKVYRYWGGKKHGNIYKHKVLKLFNRVSRRLFIINKELKDTYGYSVS